MIYTIEKANLVAEQLRRFTNGYSHHVAGQFGNIDFWLQEVQESIQTIDEYNKRFINIRDGQKRWVDAHGTVVSGYCPICGGKCELGETNDGAPAAPVRVPDNELKTARKELVDSAYFFLLRCYRMSLLNRDSLAVKCKAIDTSIDPADLEI